VATDGTIDGGSGWDADDPEYLLARIRGVVEDMSRRWRGRPSALVEAELRRRLAPLGEHWPPELIEVLVRRIGDPRWSWKHPLQALDLGRRFNARARTLAEGP
jgi:hypothetical protein